MQNPLLLETERRFPKSIAIIGAGTIGPDIGYYLKSAVPGLELILVDISQEALDRAQTRIEGYVEKGLAKRKLSKTQAQNVRERLVFTTNYEDLAHCDWVLEAATENIDLKRKIFAQVEALVRTDAIITSNTSSLPAEWLFNELKHPERATVTHFFAPAFRNPAVEVIRAERVDERVVSYLRWFFCATGKVPLVTSDALCFMLDRVFDNWCNEAALLLDQADAAQIDSATSELVHAGPFFVLNLANGNPIIVETNTLQMREEGEHYRPARIFDSVTTWKTAPPGHGPAVPEPLASTIRDRMLGVLFSQSVDILDRGIGSRADLDLGCTLALGFKKGPLQLMSELGSAEVTRILERFAKERPGMPMPKKPIESYLDYHRHLIVDDVDGIKLIAIRRPQALNALDDSVTDELLDVIRAHEADPAVQGFVIIGYGDRAFSAGADIGRFPELLGDADGAAGFARDCSRLLLHLDAMQKPVVAALNGMALGGGLELALRCHAIVAIESAWLQLPEVTLGIAPGIGAMVVPYRRWPEAADVFHGMLRRAEKLTAARAHELGVIEGLAPDYPSLVRLAVSRAHELASELPRIPDGPVEIPELAPIESSDAAGRPLSAEVISIIEDAVREGAAAGTFSESLEIGYRAFGRTACTDAAREAIGRFVSGKR